MIETILADDGTQLPMAQLEQVFVYAGGFVSTITVVYETRTYVQTFTNDATNITEITGWILT